MILANRELEQKVDELSSELKNLKKEYEEKVKELTERLDKLDSAYHRQKDHLIKQEEMLHGDADYPLQKNDAVRPYVPASFPAQPAQEPLRRQDTGWNQAGPATESAWTTAARSRKNTSMTAAENPRLQNRQAVRWASPSPDLTQSMTGDTDEKNVEAFVRRYNALPSEGGLTDREARKAFLQEFSVQGFSCANYEERMSNPDAQPRYAEADAMRADCWAMHIKEELYAVVPRAKLIYDFAHHEAGGMKVAFESNFESGHTYGRILVTRPALFRKNNGCWSLATKGKLSLSE